MKAFPAVAVLVCFWVADCSADEITGADILSVPSSTVGSGNGSLDLRMTAFSGSEIDNASGLFDGDNGNNSLPNSGGADTSLFAESYVTTAGELQDFYELNFPDGFGGSTVGELVLFLDLNETGGGQPNNWLDVVDIVLNPSSINGDPDPSLDVSSAEQAAIDQTYTGGTLIAFLDQAYNLPVLAQGAGFADYAIFTGINPFNLATTDVVLFNFSMSTLNNGAEEIFLSGELAGVDVIVPEPSGSILLCLLATCLIFRRRRLATNNGRQATTPTTSRLTIYLGLVPQIRE